MEVFADIEFLPVDKTSQGRLKLHCPIWWNNPEQRECVMEALDVDKHRNVALHLAPAYGTALKRERKNWLAGEMECVKFPSLRGQSRNQWVLMVWKVLEKVRTESANQVYSAAAKIMRACAQNGIFGSVGKPWNLTLLACPEVQEVMLVDGGWKNFSITAYTAEATEKLTKRGPNHDVFLNCRVCGMQTINMHNGTQ